MDTGPFLAIDPCGHPGLPVVTLRDLGIVAPVEQVADAIAERLLERLHP
jgi:lipoyl(octanoyl) transferase